MPQWMNERTHHFLISFVVVFGAVDWEKPLG
jgi:hypothetical protein